MNAPSIEPVSFFAALADPTRLRLLQLLARQPDGHALCVNALAMRLGVSQPAVSQHLQVVRNVGLVYAVRRGMRVHYHLNRERLGAWQHLVEELFAAPGLEGENKEGERTENCIPGDDSEQGES